MNTTHQTLVIAEAGVNHNGDLHLAKKLVDAACEWCVSLSFRLSRSACYRLAEQASYQRKALGKTQDQFSMLQQLELNYSDHAELIDYCHHQGHLFLLLLTDQVLSFVNLRLKRWKVLSGEITNLSLRQLDGWASPSSFYRYGQPW